MYEKERGALRKSSLNSKITTGRTQSEFAQRSTRSTRPKRKIILDPPSESKSYRENLEQRR